MYGTFDETSYRRKKRASDLATWHEMLLDRFAGTPEDELLDRLADSPALHDMTYIGLPPFYPPGWFWIGGRWAALSGSPAWEIYKPWAITSITIGTSSKP